MKAGMLSAWVLVVLGLSTWFFSMGKLPAPPSDGKEVEAELTELGQMSVPMVRDREIRGYLLLNVGVGVDATKKPKSKIPVDVVARDAIIATIYNNPDIDVFQLDKLDLEKLKSDILARINLDAKEGEQIAMDLYLHEIHFIPIEDIRARKGSHL
jgi:hypothetical protein